MAFDPEKLSAKQGELKPLAHVGDRPVAVEVFAGAGGLAEGFRQAGFFVALAVEKDPQAAADGPLPFSRSAAIFVKDGSVFARGLHIAWRTLNYGEERLVREASVSRTVLKCRGEGDAARRRECRSP